MNEMDLRDYFERHPGRYAITMTGAVLFLMFGIARLARAETTRQRLGALALTAVAGAEIATLARQRPVGRVPGEDFPD